MSVEINEKGEIKIAYEKTTSIDEHGERIRAILELIQQRNEDYFYPEPVFYALQMVLDMLPDDEQWYEMLKKASPH